MVNGFRDENHPNRSGVRKRWDFGGGEFPGQTPTSPPLSEQPGRGTMIDPFDADYQEVGNSGIYRTPDRSMTVGVRSATEATGPPQSEMRGRGALAPTPSERFLAENPYPQQTSSYGPVAEILNSTQWTPS